MQQRMEVNQKIRLRLADRNVGSDTAKSKVACGKHHVSRVSNNSVSRGD